MGYPTTMRRPSLDGVASAWAMAKDKLNDTLATGGMAGMGGRFLNVEAQESMLSMVRQLRVPNNLESLQITVSNNAFGPGVVVSDVGADGTAARAGLVVGDVITEVNGIRVDQHEQALNAMRGSTCAELVFSLNGKARKLVIDKLQPGKLQVTLANPKAGPGVVVEELGLMGLVAAAGVRAGDVVLAVNGALVTDHAESIALMDSTERYIELVVAQTDVDSWDSI